MGFDVDPRFKAASARAQARKVRKRLRFGLITVVCCATLGLGFFAVQGAMRGTPTEVAEMAITPPDDETFVMVEDGQSDIVAARAPFIDLPKDPLILSLSQEVDGAGVRLAAPPELDRARIGPRGPDQLTLVQDKLVVQTTRLVTTIPSSRADLAFFHAARGEALQLLEQPPDTLFEDDPEQDGAQSGDIITVSGDDGSWGALMSTENQRGDDGSATYVQTRIQNTTSTASALRETDRMTLYQDDIIVVSASRPLAGILRSAGLNEANAGRIVRAAQRHLQLPDTLNAGSVVALRLKPEGAGALAGDGNIVLQMSLYAGADYIGTLVQIGPGRFETGADPWFEDDLLARTQDVRAIASQQQEIRLLDAIYSASIRNGMPTTLVGELIVMMAQQSDLDRFAAVGDDVSILYASAPGQDGQGAGQILYAGIRGPSGSIDCYVVLNPDQDSFECYRPGMSLAAIGGIGAGLIVPVSGTRTSSFGPRMHPILQQMRDHNGVDWGAPTGTPVHAAADGIIAVAGNGGGYGNVIYINHSGARQTRYAHLNAFADGIRVGISVKVGDVIGFVGTTGRSTGPHLHFELHVNGTPVDPLTYSGQVVALGDGGAPGGAAVEALVNQIIRVESAGNANAANPRSTARGLGQFIESTWVRMMYAYRPDLARSMSRNDLLALRFNPDMSREMVRNLARESEAYLRTRGHQITAGRLYLAHFLGAEGAHIALSADPNRLVSQVMGAGVVRANPFLRGDTIGELWTWADRKMNSAPATPILVAARPAPVPAEIAAYIATIDGILGAL